MLYKITVTVEQVVDVLHDWDDEQDNPEGIYHYEYYADSDEEARELALDEFHETISIGCLDDFSISVDVSE
jgi:hypothetical protein